MKNINVELEITIRGYSSGGDKFERLFVFVRPEKIKELEETDKGIIGDMLRELGLELE